MRNEENISQYFTISRAKTTLSLHCHSIITTISIANFTKIRISLERGQTLMM